MKLEEKDALFASALCKRYKKARTLALDDFHLQMRQGDFFGLLGANGAGKTTAIAICSGLLSADSGSVTILGQSFHRRPKGIKGKIGLVPQEIALYKNLTVAENLAFFGKLHGLSKNILQERIADCLRISALTEHRDRLVATCSGGMQRRLNLVVGLINCPRILFLDEPTVGIDAQSRHLIHKQLLELNRKGTTILYTTHYMEEAQELCNRIGIIDKGRLIWVGKPAAILTESGAETLKDFFLQLTGEQLRDG